MFNTNPTPFVKSPWLVVEVFLVFLVVRLLGEFMGAVAGEVPQLGLAVAELAIGLGLSQPTFSGKRWGYVAMGCYLIFTGLSMFWLLLGGAGAIAWIYHGPLAVFFAAGGLKLLLHNPASERK